MEKILYLNGQQDKIFKIKIFHLLGFWGFGVLGFWVCGRGGGEGFSEGGD